MSSSVLAGYRESLPLDTRDYRGQTLVLNPFRGTSHIKKDVVMEDSVPIFETGRVDPVPSFAAAPGLMMKARLKGDKSFLPRKQLALKPDITTVNTHIM